MRRWELFNLASLGGKLSIDWLSVVLAQAQCDQCALSHDAVASRFAQTMSVWSETLDETHDIPIVAR